MHRMFCMQEHWHMPSVSLWNSSTTSGREKVLAAVISFTHFIFQIFLKWFAIKKKHLLNLSLYWKDCFEILIYEKSKTGLWISPASCRSHVTASFFFYQFSDCLGWIEALNECNPWKITSPDANWKFLVCPHVCPASSFNIDLCGIVLLTVHW